MSFLGTYDVGDQPRFTCTFNDPTGALIDPTTVKFVVRGASGTQTVYTYGVDAAVTRVSLGLFRLTHPQLVAADAGKTFFVRANGSGTAVASDEDSFKVKPTAFSSPLP